MLFPIVADMNRTMTDINVIDHKEQEDSGLIAAIIIFSGSLLITLAALVSCPSPLFTPILPYHVLCASSFEPYITLYGIWTWLDLYKKL